MSGLRSRNKGKAAQTIRYLAIDPGVKACGLAWRPWRGDGILTASASIDDLWITMSDNLTGLCQTVAVFEEANGYGPNIKAAFKLCEARGRLIEMLANFGFRRDRILRVNVTTWQSAMLGKRVVKGDTKKRSIESARTLGVDTNDDNIADAVNLLVYAELNQLGVEDAA